LTLRGAWLSLLGLPPIGLGVAQWVLSGRLGADSPARRVLRALAIVSVLLGVALALAVVWMVFRL